MYKLSDFKKGQTAYVELTGYASRGKSKNDLIEEWEIISVGRKYVTASKVGCKMERKFMETDCNYGGLIEKTEYCVDYVLYPCLKDIEERFEFEYLRDELRGAFSDYRKTPYTLEQLRQVHSILF